MKSSAFTGRGAILASALRMIIILAVSAGAGLGYARYKNVRFFPDPDDEPALKRWQELTKISVEELVEFNNEGGTIVDARPRELYEEGHLDGPMVINIPANEVMDSYHAARIEQYNGMELVIYCASTECEDAKTLWDILVNQFDFQPNLLRVYHEGWRGIQAAHLPTVTGPDPFAYPADDLADPNAGADTGLDESAGDEMNPDDMPADDSNGG